MNRRVLAAFSLVAAVCASLFLARGSTAGQAAGAGPAWTPSRTPDGQPDLQGVWVNGAAGDEPATWETRPAKKEKKQDFFEGSLAYLRDHGEPATPRNLIVDPADAKIPYQAWAFTRRAYLQAHGEERVADIDPRGRCLLPGVPRQFFPYNYSDGHVFLQSPNQVVILSEWNHAYRVIPLDGRPHPGPDIHLWMGDSRGHWEGNTLVVDVTNFTDKTHIDKQANFHSEALHVVERYTLVDANTITYEATMEDPKVYTRPWKISLPLKRPAEKTYEVFEYACHEGNRGAAGRSACAGLALGCAGAAIPRN